MSASFYPLTDSLTMLRRVLVHMLRNPMITILSTLVIPIILLLLVYNVFGGAVQSVGTTGSSYIDYLTPGMTLITAMYCIASAALRINADMTKGIISRFRSMSISRDAVLFGHVIGSTLGTLISIAAIFGLAYLMGFRSTANAAEWLAALGLLVLVVVAIMWLAVAVGVASRTPEAASSMLLPINLLPFFSSAFVPTTSMTPVVAWIAQNQPFTPVVDTLRALLMDEPVGNRGFVAVAWCLGIGLVGYLWARTAYNRNTNQ